MSKMNNNICSVSRKKESAFGIHQKLMKVAADELPLNLLITGNLKGNQITRRWMSELPLLSTAITSTQSFQADEREFVVQLNSDAPNEQMYVNLKVKSMDDLSPDHIASPVPEIKRLLELREAWSHLSLH